MNQLSWQCDTVSRIHRHTTATQLITLLSIVLVTSLLSDRVYGSATGTATGIANEDNPIVEHTNSSANTHRQATLTVDGKSTVHTYTTETTATASKQPTATVDRQIASYNPILWIFDISLNLNTDYDRDGHYSNFSLTLDLDTTLTATTVYAVLYLANEGGPWTEYAITGNFTVSGSGSADTFSLQAELDSGYPSGYYNHYIEVYDAYTHELIGTYGPEDSHQLFGLPIESRQHDGEFTFNSDVSLSFTGSGALGPAPLVLLAVVLMFRRRLKANAHTMNTSQ